MGKLLFITGGVRSGKSSYAEKLAVALRKSNEVLIYLACGVVTDFEMEERIIKHRLDRQSSPENWTTIERPKAIHGIVESIPSNSIVLLDCLTTLLTNELFSLEKVDSTIVEKEIYQAVKLLMDKADVLIVVSNEVLYDIPSNSKDILRFQRTLGKLHMNMVEMAHTAIDMTVGVPVVKKGAT
ncbi:bifunctional adenosylcobinamide kinase/adenosylcobinamide-phosphate guanylyltransferase [Rossellomorea aquimaris]|uniref:bifunctional adenosylcobinamide kinase/adenosylcobinamide-phosphate guanylyltransferase n=1 Tax=Rossellomorea aquimaris TaxID=189382 RepID=UPI001CD29F44|nr:bifunctional adenosylcobinamide kinase/adenosylcobinamide-phosphate guanylyltransferase [Rossellomorea aquimaris]MCA1058606.1 bifunctional adenosylcobinamide kinase/adenosylcobinamide-phosphate guanylyltransferase [Rossellomorea aquimaris]